MTVTLEMAQDRLDTFASALPARSGPDAERLLGEAREIFSELNTAEGEHITQALAIPSFPFTRAQSELEGCFQELARLTERMLELGGGVLTAPDWDSLEELSYLAKHAPLVSETTLARIRARRARRRETVA